MVRLLSVAFLSTLLLLPLLGCGDSDGGGSKPTASAPSAPPAPPGGPPAPPSGPPAPPTAAPAPPGTPVPPGTVATPATTATPLPGAIPGTVPPAVPADPNATASVPTPGAPAVPVPSTTDPAATPPASTDPALRPAGSETNPAVPYPAIPGTTPAPVQPAPVQPAVAVPPGSAIIPSGLPGGGNPYVANPQASTGPTLNPNLPPFERAAEAFRAGKDVQALTALYTHYLSNPDVSSLPAEMPWMPGLKKPAVVVRWGVGIVYTAPRGYAGHPRPIGFGDDAQAAQRAAKAPKKSLAELRRERAAKANTSGQPGQVAQVPVEPLALVTFYTGDLGDQILDGLEARIMDGRYGKVLAEALKKPAPVINYAAVAAQPPPKAGMPDPAKAAKILAEMRGEKTSTPFDPAAIAAELERAAADTKPLLPGVTLLGVGTAADLEKKAKTLQLDLLLIFDVNVRPATASDIVSNNTRFRLVAVTRNEEIFESTQLNNQKVSEARSRPNAEDPVAAELAKFALAIDEKLKPSELPESITPELAKKRVEMLAKEGLVKLLPNVLEMRRYQAAGLISETDLLATIGPALGPEGMAMLMQMAGGGAAGQLPDLGGLLDGFTKKPDEDAEKAP